MPHSSPSLIGLLASVDVKLQTLTRKSGRVQELCESRGGRPELSVLTIFMVSVDVKQYWTVLRHWSQFVPNMSTDIRGHEALLHHLSVRCYHDVKPERQGGNIHSCPTKHTKIMFIFCPTKRTKTRQYSFPVLPSIQRQDNVHFLSCQAYEDTTLFISCPTKHTKTRHCSFHVLPSIQRQDAVHFLSYQAYKDKTLFIFCPTKHTKTRQCSFPVLSTIQRLDTVHFLSQQPHKDSSRVHTKFSENWFNCLSSAF